MGRYKIRKELQKYFRKLEGTPSTCVLLQTSTEKYKHAFG